MHRITVIGAGYVGLVTAVGLTALGHRVHLVERSIERLTSLCEGIVPIHEAGLQEGLDAARAAGLITIAGNLEPESDAYFLCVGTPMDERGHADLQPLDDAIGILQRATDREGVVVVRSTLPLGTTLPLIQRHGPATDRILTNPEFLRQGTALHDFLHPARIVIGAGQPNDGQAVQLISEVYSSLDAPTIVVGYAEAEVIKNAANAFLALKLSFANEMAALCEAYGADVDAVLDGIGRDPRIGRQYMQPSFGFGGSCLPKELQTVAMAGLERGLEMHVTAAAAEANLAHQDRFVERVKSLLPDDRAGVVGQLGLAFKANTDDVRSSPAIRVARRLMEAGHRVRAYDPAASAGASRELPSLEIVDVGDEVFDQADLVAVTTEWPAFSDLDWERLVPMMRNRVVVDGRRLLDPERMKRLDVRFERVGSPPGEGIARVV
jgi:UDPglucose 6-dehydrogenase